jgi:hypothetical protein
LENYFQNASLSVITIGNDKQVRINTNYKIDDKDAAVDDEISELLYNGLKTYCRPEPQRPVYTRKHCQFSKVGRPLRMM